MSSKTNFEMGIQAVNKLIDEAEKTAQNIISGGAKIAKTIIEQSTDEAKKIIESAVKHTKETVALGIGAVLTTACGTNIPDENTQNPENTDSDKQPVPIVDKQIDTYELNDNKITKLNQMNEVFNLKEYRNQRTFLWLDEKTGEPIYNVSTPHKQIYEKLQDSQQVLTLAFEGLTPEMDYYGDNKMTSGIGNTYENHSPKPLRLNPSGNTDSKMVPFYMLGSKFTTFDEYFGKRNELWTRKSHNQYLLTNYLLSDKFAKLDEIDGKVLSALYISADNNPTIAKAQLDRLVETDKDGKQRITTDKNKMLAIFQATEVTENNKIKINDKHKAGINNRGTAEFWIATGILTIGDVLNSEYRVGFSAPIAYVNEINQINDKIDKENEQNKKNKQNTVNKKKIDITDKEQVRSFFKTKGIIPVDDNIDSGIVILTPKDEIYTIKQFFIDNDSIFNKNVTRFGSGAKGNKFDNDYHRNTDAIQRAAFNKALHYMADTIMGYKTEEPSKEEMRLARLFALGQTTHLKKHQQERSKYILDRIETSKTEGSKAVLKKIEFFETDIIMLIMNGIANNDSLDINNYNNIVKQVNSRIDDYYKSSKTKKTAPAVRGAKKTKTIKDATKQIKNKKQNNPAPNKKKQNTPKKQNKPTKSNKKTGHLWFDVFRGNYRA